MDRKRDRLIKLRTYRQLSAGMAGLFLYLGQSDHRLDRGLVFPGQGIPGGSSEHTDRRETVHRGQSRSHGNVGGEKAYYTFLFIEFLLIFIIESVANGWYAAIFSTSLAKQIYNNRNTNSRYLTTMQLKSAE